MHVVYPASDADDVEKLDYIVWKAPDIAIGEQRDALIDALNACVGDVAALSVAVADTDDAIPDPPLLLGRGADAAAIVSVWLDSVDDRNVIEGAIGASADGYLVTESVPQRRGPTDRSWADGEQSPGITHCTWFPKPDRLSEKAFFHGWHDVHTPSSFALHPLRWEYVRDAVARAVTPDAPPIRAVVLERFRTVEDYADPARLYGPPETLDATMRELPLYADFESINSRPMYEVILKS